MRVKILLTHNDTVKTLTDSDLFAGITIRKDINNGDDLICGILSCAECTFTIDNTQGWFNDDYKQDKIEVFIKQMDEEDYKAYGVFHIYEAEKIKNTVKITAYDYMQELSETIVDEWLNNLTFPISMYSMLQSLCNYLNVSLANTSSSITNNDFSVQDNFNGTNITAGQILSYITQAAGSYAFFNTNNALELKWYTEKDISLTVSETVSTAIAEFACPNIDKVQIRLTDDDIGVISGTGTNAYVIQDNPILYANSSDEIQSVADNLLAKLGALTYTPSSIDLLKDYGIDVGDIITCKGIKTIVSSKEINPSGIHLSCTGQIKRSTQQPSIHTQLNKLRGKYNELTRTIEATVSRLGDAEGNISEIKQTSTKIQSTVSQVQQTANNAMDTANQAEYSVSQISQTADKINWLVKSGTSESNFEMTDRAVSLISSNISVTGYVRFEDLSETGATTINGSNITTGTINADLITPNLNGVYINFSSAVSAPSFYSSIFNLGSGADICIGSSSTNGGISTYYPNNISISGTTVFDSVPIVCQYRNGGYIFDTVLTSNNYSDFISDLNLTAKFG